MTDRALFTKANEVVRIEHTGFTDWSAQQILTIATDPTIPSPPTLAATAADQAIDLTITAPTTNTDGTAITDILEYNIYYDTTDAIDVTNNATYAGVYSISATKKTHPTSAQHYFKATCVDKWGNESAGSNEVNATPIVASGVPVSIDDYTDNFDSILTGYGNIGIIFNVPKPTWERWAGWKLYANNDGGAGSGALTGDPVADGDLIYTGSGGSFIHKGLNTEWLYEYGLVVLGEDGTVTSGTVSNNSGAGYQPNETDNSNFDGTVIASRVVSTGEVRGDHFYASSYLHIGVPGWQSDGCQFEYNGGNPRGYIGDGADAFFKYDGTKITWKAANTELDDEGNLIATSATLSGAITATSGAIGGFTLATHLYTGSKTAYNDTNAGIHIGTDGIGIGNNVFTVSAAGALVATSATITGAVTISSGSGIANLSDAGALAVLNVVGTAQIDNLAVTSAKIKDLSFDKITAATNTASLTIGGSGYLKSSNYSAGSAGFKIDGDGDAEFNDVTVRGKIIANVSGSSVPWGYVSGVNVTYGQIAANAVRTNEIYIDGDVDFSAVGTRQACKGINGLYFSNTKNVASPHILINAGNLYLSEGTGRASLTLDETGVVLTNNGYNSILTISSGDDIYLEPGINNEDAVIGTFKYINYRIYNGNAPTSWEEVDASEQVGSRRALLLLRIENNGSGSMNVRFRPSDESGEQDPNCHDWPGAFGTRVDDIQEVQWVWVLTGTTGRYDWDSDVNNSCYVNILGYFA